MRKGTAKAIVKILVGILVGFVQLSSNGHAIVRPINAQAIGFDAWGIALYVLCLWLVTSGVRFFFQTNQVQG